LKWFAVFFGEEKPFPVEGTDLKIVARWRYDWYTNACENFQNLKNGCKVCAHHFCHLELRSEVKEKFYHSLLPHVL